MCSGHWDKAVTHRHPINPSLAQLAGARLPTVAGQSPEPVMTSLPCDDRAAKRSPGPTDDTKTEQGRACYSHSNESRTLLFMHWQTQAALPCHAALTCLDTAKSEGIRGTAPAKSLGTENLHILHSLPAAGFGGVFS